MCKFIANFFILGYIFVVIHFTTVRITLDHLAVTIFMLVGIANVVDMQIIGAGSALKIAVEFFFISNEGISILENSAFLGVPIPDELKRVLKQIKHHDKDRKGKK